VVVAVNVMVLVVVAVFVGGTSVFVRVTVGVFDTVEVAVGGTAVFVGVGRAHPFPKASIA